MVAKLRIDLAQGVIEVEGPEDLVRSIYDDFKENVHTPSKAALNAKTTAGDTQPRPTPSQSQGGERRKGAGKQALPKVVSDLDLSGAGKVERLREFFGTFKSSTNFERNLIFVYYLTQKLKINGITPDHVFTCYRDVPGIKAPGALRQSLLDTSREKGWLNTSDMNGIEITVPGINYLEHDLPRNETAK